MANSDVTREYENGPLFVRCSKLNPLDNIDRPQSDAGKFTEARRLWAERIAGISRLICRAEASPAGFAYLSASNVMLVSAVNFL
jgi:hypothetical protein